MTNRTVSASPLERAIRLPHAIALVVGTIVGASIFVQPSEISGIVPSVPGVLAVWIASGALTLVGALVLAELAARYPKTGGVYVYLTELFHPAAGFLWGWAMFWSMHSGIIAAIAVIFARYAGFFLPLGAVGTKLTAIGLIALLSAVNYFGVRHGSRLQTAFTAGKLIAIVAIVALGFALGGRVARHFVGSAHATTPSVGAFLTAMAAGLFAYGGWHMVTYNADETVDPGRTIPRALIWGTVIVTLSYVAMNLVYLYVLPLDQVAQSTRVAADAADRLLGFGGGGVMAAIVLFSTFGAVAGIVLAGPRVYYAMAEDGLLFRWFGAIHPRFHTPHRAIVLQGIWASVLVALGTFRGLFLRVVYTEWIFFGLLAVGLLKIRGRAGRVILPVLFAAASFAVVVNQLVTNTAASVTGLALVAAGLPVYYLWGRRGLERRSTA